MAEIRSAGLAEHGARSAIKSGATAVSGDATLVCDVVGAADRLARTDAVNAGVSVTTLGHATIDHATAAIVNRPALVSTTVRHISRSARLGADVVRGRRTWHGNGCSSARVMWRARCPAEAVGHLEPSGRAI